MNDLTRRNFTRATAFTTPLSYSRIFGANERVRVGYIGLGNRGDQVHEAFLEHGDQQTVVVCDLRDDYMDFAIKKSRSTPKKYTDYHALLEDTRPLARADVHGRLLCRERRVRGEAPIVDGGRRAEDGGGGGTHAPCVAGRHSTPLHGIAKRGGGVCAVRR